VIIRVVTARVPDRHAGKFEDLLRAQLPLMRQYDGLMYVKLARQVVPGFEEVMLFEEWRDSRALYAWAGPSIDTPRLMPGAEALVEDVRVTHYEALDIEPDMLYATDGRGPVDEPMDADPAPH
jgi:Antibiotic biosynthesis monooxygenase